MYGKFYCDNIIISLVIMWKKQGEVVNRPDLKFGFNFICQNTLL